MQKLYVGNLSYDTTQEGLQSHFEAAGTVTSAAVITDKFTGRSRGFGFIEMGSPEEAQKAIDELDGKELDGRPLKVSLARPKDE